MSVKFENDEAESFYVTSLVIVINFNFEIRWLNLTLSGKNRMPSVLELMGDENQRVNFLLWD